MVGSAHFKEERKDHQIGESKVYQTRKKNLESKSQGHLLRLTSSIANQALIIGPKLSIRSFKPSMSPSTSRKGGHPHPQAINLSSAT